MRYSLIYFLFIRTTLYGQIEESKYNASDSLIEFQSYEATSITITIDTVKMSLFWYCHNGYQGTKYESKNKILSFKKEINEKDSVEYFNFHVQKLDSEERANFIIQQDLKLYILKLFNSEGEVSYYYVTSGKGLTIIYN